MKPPKCRLCGAEEWNHVCGGGAHKLGQPLDDVTKPRDMSRKRVTPVTKPRDSVMAPCPECERKDKQLKAAARALKEAQAEIDALHGEVAMFKRSRAGSDKPAPMTAAERKRRERAKRKLAAQHQFEG